ERDTMDERAAAFLDWLKSRSQAEWLQIAADAREVDVGGWVWDQAWQSAPDRHAAGTAVANVVAGSVDPVAFAAAAGALAALMAGSDLDPDAAALLKAPFAHSFASEPARRREPALSV